MARTYRELFKHLYALVPKTPVIWMCRLADQGSVEFRHTNNASDIAPETQETIMTLIYEVSRLASK